VPALTRGWGETNGTSYGVYAVSAVSYLLFGDWLMERGGPRVYLAAYNTTNHGKHDVLERMILTGLAAAREEQKRWKR
jgi:hypothetical protein